VSDVLIRGAQLLGASEGDLGIRNGVFVPADDVHAGAKKTRVVDASGLVAPPGLVPIGLPGSCSGWLHRRLCNG
jgi:predicted amidohydrolase